MNKTIKDIDTYLSLQEEDKRAALVKLRTLINTTAPDSVEVISYGMPAFKLNGKMLIGFAAFKNHCSLFPWNSSTIEVFAEELKNYTTSKGTIQFTVSKPLPVALVKKIIKFRMNQNAEKAKAKSKK